MILSGEEMNQFVIWSKLKRKGTKCAYTYWYFLYILRNSEDYNDMIGHRRWQFSQSPEDSHECWWLDLSCSCPDVLWKCEISLLPRPPPGSLSAWPWKDFLCLVMGCQIAASFMANLGIFQILYPNAIREVWRQKWM